MSLRRWLGWEPSTTTRVTERDEHGRPSAWVSTPEPEWDDDERDIMAALHVLRQDQCPHGHALEYMTDQSPADEIEGDGPGYGMRVTDVWCRACRALDAQTAAHRKHDQALSGTPLDEAPGRYMIVQQIPIPT